MSRLTARAVLCTKPSESDTNARESVSKRTGDEIKFIWYRTRCEESVMGQLRVQKTPTSVCRLKARRERGIVRHLNRRLSCGFVLKLAENWGSERSRRRCFQKHRERLEPLRVLASTSNEREIVTTSNCYRFETFLLMFPVIFPNWTVTNVA